MDVVGGAVLSALFGVLFDKLASPLLLKFARRKKVDTELKKWEKILMKINAVLEDAEEKQMTSRLVKIWLGELRDLAYDVEDILDEFVTVAVLQPNLVTEPQASASKVRSLIPTCCTSFPTPNDIMFNLEMGSKIKEITARLEDISTQKVELGLENIAGPTSTWQRPPATSLSSEPCIYGRDEDRRMIVDLLLKNDEMSGSKVGVIPIIGMGGIGKTTLAQLVYNDKLVKEYFDSKAWVCVSDVFDVMRITKSILDAVTSQTNDLNDLNQLQVKLSEALVGKRLLLILDDVWNKNYGDWDLLSSAFITGAEGSKIIVTTRDSQVALMVAGNDNCHYLKHLSYDESWSVFVQHAFEKRNIDAHPSLELIGKKIVDKCGGLPLAAKALGGLLRSKLKDDEWEDILNSKIWSLPANETGILPALKLSYYHLPSHLKRCFIYCALFPKDYEFVPDDLVLQWMADGLVPQPSDGKRKVEDIGNDYFWELLSRSSFLPSSSNNSRFVMHDLINDLAQFVAGETCFHLEDQFDANQQLTISGKVRYLSFIRCKYEVFKRFENFYNMKSSLRTLLAFPIHGHYYDLSYLTTKLSHDIVPKLRHLRVLSLTGYEIHELPDSVGALKQLRYLNFSCTMIQGLPNSVGDLYNLQTLLLSDCKRLTVLPTRIGNLINLRHLDLTHTRELKEMPAEICKLKSLQTLSKFIVGKSSGLGMKKLKDFLQLRGKLSILDLQNVVDVQDARDASLKDKHDLEELRMKWGGNIFYHLGSDVNEIQILETLQPNTNLKKLTIKHYDGPEFPCWIGDPSFSKMVSVKLSHCRKCTFLPSLGKLSLLKDLCIEGMKKVKNVGLEFCSEASSSIKPFPSLKTLTFSDMPEWEEWLSSSESFPCLQVLRIFDCPKLIKKLPDHLPSLSKLYISFCPVLAVSLPRLPSLRELSVTHCNEVVLRNGVDLASLITLDLSNISQLTCLQEGLVRFLGALEVLRIHECNELKFLLHNGVGFQNLACVRRLSIGNCSQLVALSEEDHGSLPSLEHLWIEDCANLEKLPSGLKSFTSLMKLSIKKCPKLVSFPETGLPPMLRVLELNDCESLKSLPNGMMANSNNMELCLLEQLKIWKCSSLTCFPSGELPTTLMKLDIGLCENLQSLPKGLMHNSSTCHLEILKIFCCSSLMSFPRGYLPSSVKSLAISNWPQLQAISESWTNNNSLEYLRISELKIDNLGILHSLAHLTELDIHKCPGIESFPESGWSIPNLRMLRICFCENLKSLPHQMQNFTSLRDLDVYDCPSLVSFPEGGLPPNLTSFMIRDCQNLKTPLSEWGLHHLPFLKTLYLSNVIPSSDDECLPPLPTTLTFLHIGDFPNLKSLSSLSLQNLTSLETLQILGCPKLQYFLPKEGLPAALSILSILSCPILRKRCQKDKGTDWPKISHIPCVDII